MAGTPAGTLSIDIVAEVARLQNDLDKAKRMVRSASNDIAKSAGAANDNLAGMGRTIGATGRASRLASHHMQNLSFQVQDIAVGLASGQRPMTVLLQQGTQIGGIMQQAGLGVGGFLKEVGLIAAKAGPAAVVIGALGVVTYQYKSALDEAVPSADQFISTLGLTGEEIEKLTDTTVTYGDVAMGTWDVVSQGLWDIIGPAVTDTKQSFNDWFWESDRNARASTNRLIGFFVGAFNGIQAVWSRLPAAMGDAFFSAVNRAIEAINLMLSRATRGVNLFLDSVNSALGLSIPTLSAPQIGMVANSYAGAAQAASEAWQAEMDAAQRDYLGDWGQNILEAAVDRRNQRLSAQARELIDGRSGRSGRSQRARGLSEEEKALQQATKAALDYIAALETETVRIGKNAIQIKRMEIAANAAIAPTEELRQRIVAAGLAWEMVTRAQADADFEKNIIQPLREELALLGLTGTARERAALTLQREAIMAQWAADGVTDLNAKWREYLNLHEQIWQQQARFDALKEYEEIENSALDALNEGLVDAIVNFRSLGDVAQSVIRQILADLLRLQIQQSITGPLAAALGMGGGGGGGGLLGSVTSMMDANPGLFAKGTLSAPAGMAIVGEEGPELVNLRGGERIYPARQTQQMLGGSTTINVNVSGRMSERERRETGGDIARRIRRELNGPIPA